jgi:hypothetical protein
MEMENLAPESASSQGQKSADCNIKDGAERAIP